MGRRKTAVERATNNLLDRWKTISRAHAATVRTIAAAIASLCAVEIIALLSAISRFWPEKSVIIAIIANRASNAAPWKELISRILAGCAKLTARRSRRLQRILS